MKGEREKKREKRKNRKKNQPGARDRPRRLRVEVGQESPREPRERAEPDVKARVPRVRVRVGRILRDRERLGRRRPFLFLFFLVSGVEKVE